MSRNPQMPPDSTFGLDFNYEVWTAGTQVTLCNVPWDNSYRDVVNMDTQLDLQRWLKTQSGPVITISSMTYAKAGRPVRIDIPFNKAYKYNYLLVENTTQPIAGDEFKMMCYFILDVNYIAPNTTELVVQLDVWSTFGYQVDFGSAYIEQGHIGIANENQDSNYGRDYLTTPEGLDIGGEYSIQKNYIHTLSSGRNATPDYQVMVVSTVNLTADPGNVDDPKLNTATGSNMENLPNGASIYIFPSMSDFTLFLREFSTKPWVTQGIISVTAIPDEFTIPGSMVPIGDQGRSVKVPTNGPIKPVMTSNTADFRADAREKLPARYRHLGKFLTYPYMVLELTTYNGQPIIIKPESWADTKGQVVLSAHFAPPGARVVMYPYRYNAQGMGPTLDNYGVFNDGGEFLDFATGISDFPTFSVVNNGYMSFMASNRNGIAFQNQSADWSQNKALQGNQLGANQASANIGTANQMTGLGVNAAMAQNSLANETAGFQAIQSAANGVIGGIGSGPMGVGSALMSGANAAAGYAITTNQNNKGTAISTGLAQSQNTAQTSNMAYMRDTNKGYADFAAKGDYQNAIAGINAKVQDARLTQPTTSGQVGGDAFNLAQYQWGYDLKVKMLQPGPMAVVGEYWLRYGYSVGRFVRQLPPLMRCMDTFTYWKLRETYLTASECPEAFKQTIRGIFEKGVTVWNRPEDIGRVDLGANEPLEGITL